MILTCRRRLRRSFAPRYLGELGNSGVTQLMGTQQHIAAVKLHTSESN
jgi:hypothetical protein